MAFVWNKKCVIALQEAWHNFLKGENLQYGVDRLPKMNNMGRSIEPELSVQAYFSIFYYYHRFVYSKLPANMGHKILLKTI